MSIPVNALKVDELLHYAALDPGAAAELTRRIAESSVDPSAEREELRDDIRRLEFNLDESERDAKTCEITQRKHVSGFAERLTRKIASCRLRSS